MKKKMDWMPYFASDGNPRRLNIEVIRRIAIAIIVSDPLAVDTIFFLPDAVTGDSEGCDVLFFIMTML